MIGGEAVRAALRLATLLVLLSAVTVVFQDRSSAGFVVAVMALGVSVLFLTVVLVVARMDTPRVPPRGTISPKEHGITDPGTGDRSHGRDT